MLAEGSSSGGLYQEADPSEREGFPVDDPGQICDSIGVGTYRPVSKSEREG
jgi:hypothetical protein